MSYPVSPDCVKLTGCQTENLRFPPAEEPPRNENNLAVDFYACRRVLNLCFIADVICLHAHLAFNVTQCC